MRDLDTLYAMATLDSDLDRPDRMLNSSDVSSR
jgi:hypothetical protein